MTTNVKNAELLDKIYFKFSKNQMKKSDNSKNFCELTEKRTNFLQFSQKAGSLRIDRLFSF